MMATCPEEAFRDGAQAVALAERACQLTDRKDASLLDTLAAAYAEAGRFDQAVQTVREAISLPEADNQPRMVEAFRKHLEFYEAGKLNRTIMTFIDRNVRLPVQLFGDLRGKNLDDKQKELLEEWKASRYGAFEVESGRFRPSKPGPPKFRLISSWEAFPLRCP